MAIIHVEDLSFAYPDGARKALDGICLDVAAGSLTCLCGRSGCGKTTLLRHLKGVLAPHGERAGEVLFDGHPLAEVDEREQARRIGFVMQDPDAQVITDSVWHEMAFGLENLGYERRVMGQRVAEVAAFLGIQGWFHADTAELSGGQRQLVNLASVLVLEPDVLVLDEPTAQLDPIAAERLLFAVQRVNRELGITVIISEQRLGEVFPMADTVLVMDAGRIVAQGSPRDVARRLYEAHDPMCLALPTPARVFYGVEGIEQAEETSRDCPLSVREGRTWLDEYAKGHGSSSRALPDEAREHGAGDCAIRLRDVRFRYARSAPDVLSGLDLEIPAKGVFALMGPNGSGKSTLLRVLCGIERPQQGKVEVFGRRLRDWGRGELFRGTLAMLPQDSSELFTRGSVADELDEMLDVPKTAGGSRDALLAETIARCELEELLDADPHDLSQGEKRRVALAKVLLARPRVLLLDEPTKGIDAFSKAELGGLLRQLAQEGRAVVIVSHDVEFCARHADRVALLFDGRIAAEGTPREHFSSSTFYTTAASRMSRGVFQNAVTDEDVISLCVR